MSNSYNDPQGYEQTPEDPIRSRQKPAQQQQYQPEIADAYGQEEDEHVCNFCGRYDEAFNSESIDIHYWKECPMLTTCWECEQVIEIQFMADHLVNEC